MSDSEANRRAILHLAKAMLAYGRVLRAISAQVPALQRGGLLSSSPMLDMEAAEDELQRAVDEVLRHGAF